MEVKNEKQNLVLVIFQIMCGQIFLLSMLNKILKQSYVFKEISNQMLEILCEKIVSTDGLKKNNFVNVSIIKIILELCFYLIKCLSLFHLLL